MEHNETNTLESIIRAAKEMSRLRNREKAETTAETEIEAKAKTESENKPEENKPVEIKPDRKPETELQVNTPAEKTTDEEQAEQIAQPEQALQSGQAPQLEQTSQTEHAVAKSPYVDPDPEEEVLDFSDSAALLSAALTFSDTLQTSSVHFLEFSVAFTSMVRRHYQQDGNGDLRANSLAFHALLALDSWSNDHYTMSDLAEKLQIPKQQLTKLINDLETKELVERIHDTENRRRVYIRICEKGHLLMEELKQEMLQSTLHGLRSYSKDDLLELDHCICRLTELMEKFNTDPA